MCLLYANEHWEIVECIQQEQSLVVHLSKSMKNKVQVYKNNVKLLFWAMVKQL